MWGDVGRYSEAAGEMWRDTARLRTLVSPLHLPYISRTSPLHLPYISPTSPLHLPYISPRPAVRSRARKCPAYRLLLTTYNLLLTRCDLPCEAEHVRPLPRHLARVAALRRVRVRVRLEGSG